MDLSKLEPRFRDKVILQRYTNCWLWAAGVDRDGYGQYSINDVSFKAHRVAYERIRGPIPCGMVIDHGCKNPSCVNPAHMEPVTSGENVRRGLSFSTANRNKTHCVNGHPLDGDNLLLVKHGRACKLCYRQSVDRYRRKPDVMLATNQRARDRYQTDPDYREQVKAWARQQYHKKKAAA